MAIYSIVVAAGVGKRFGGAQPKQYTKIAGQTVLQHSIQALSQVSRLSGCYLVVAADDAHAKTLAFAQPVHWVVGGDERMHSVFNGVKAIWHQAKTPENDWVLIHDAARPCVLPSDIDKLIDQAMACSAGGILAVPVRDTVKQITQHGAKTFAQTTIDRSQLWLAQTPQLFPLAKLYAYLQQAVRDAIPFTDEASLFEHFGEQPLLVEGRHSNIKLTFPEDLLVAESLLTRALA